MNKYEKTRIISARALQIAQGAPPLVSPKSKSVEEIVLEEFDKDKIPLVVV